MEQCLEGCPASHAKGDTHTVPTHTPRAHTHIYTHTHTHIYTHIYTLIHVHVLVICAVAIYLLYAKLEEEHGLARRAMSVYDRATRAVQADQQLEVSTC